MYNISWFPFFRKISYVDSQFFKIYFVLNLQPLPPQNYNELALIDKCSRFNENSYSSATKIDIMTMTMNDNENILFDHNIQIYITDLK